MGRFTETLRWTFQNDMAFPFVELVLFLMVYLAISFHSLDSTEVLQRPLKTTWDLIYIIVFVSGIGGIRSFSMAMEKGELSRQLMASRTSRVRFMLSKIMSFYLSTIVLVLIADLAVLAVYMIYYFDPSVYVSLGLISPLIWGLALAEQFILLLFLDSLIAFLSFVSKSATVSLFLLLAITLLGVSLYQLGLPGWAENLQLGYGDYNIVNRISSYLFNLIYLPSNVQMLSPPPALLIGIAYRLVGGAVLFIAAILRFNTMDLD